MDDQQYVPTLTLLPSTTTTVVTTTTTTTTHYPPIPLPLPPSPTTLCPALPLNPSARAPPSPQSYPLIHLPLPPQAQSYLLPGARAAYHSGDPNIPLAGRLPSEDRGQTWARMRREGEGEGDILAGGSIKDAIERYLPSPLVHGGSGSGGKGRKRMLSNGAERQPSVGASSSQQSQTSDVRMSEGPPSPAPPSPPRKKARAHPIPAHVHISTTGLHPLPSPSNSPPPTSPPQISQSTTTTQSSPPQLPVLPLQTLLSLPTLLTHYTSLPVPLQSHVLLSMLRLSPLSVLRSASSFLAPALSRDFLAQLPVELALHILRLLDLRSLLRAGRVCRGWRNMINHETPLWRSLLKQYNLWLESPSRASLPPRIRLRAHIRLPIDYPRALPPPNPYKDLLQHRLRLQQALALPPTQLTIPLPTQTVVTCLQLSSTRIVSASDEHTIHVHSPRTGQLLLSLNGHSGGVWALQFVRDTLVSGSTDRTVRVWDLRTGRNSHVFGGHTSTVRCLQIVERGERGEWPRRRMIVTGSRDNSLRLWYLPREGDREYRSPVTGESEAAERDDPKRNPFHVRAFIGHSSAVRALAARGRTLVSGSYDCTVRVWDLATGECRHVLTGHAQKVYSVTLDPVRDQCASGSMDGTVRIWSLATGQCLHSLSGHTSLVGLLSVRPTQLISAAADSTLRVWSPETGQLVHTLTGHPAAITCFLHDEFRVLSGSEGSLKMWDADRGEWRRDLLTDVGGVWQVAGWGRRVVSACNRGDETFLDVFEWGGRAKERVGKEVEGEGEAALLSAAALGEEEESGEDDEESEESDGHAHARFGEDEDMDSDGAADGEDEGEGEGEEEEEEDEIQEIQPWELKTPTPSRRRRPGARTRERARARWLPAEQEHEDEEVEQVFYDVEGGEGEEGSTMDASV